MNYINFFQKHKLLLIVIAALALGLAGGVIGSLIGRGYLADFYYNLPPYGNLNFSAGRYKDQGFIISNARNVIVEQDAKIDETINSTSGSLVGIYKKQKAGKAAGDFALENFYKLSDSLGQGFIITADGWLVTNLALDKTYDDYVVITKDRKVYPIDRAEADDLTKFYFLHVPANDLSVRKFAENQKIKPGSLAVIVNWHGLSRISTVAGFSQSAGLVKSSDNFSQKLVLNDKLSSEFRGAAVFNLAGEALGLVDNQAAVEPISRFFSASQSLFKNQSVVRPSLGVNYLDLTRLAESGSQRDSWRKGALIYKDQKGAAVIKGGAAEKAGLREGDIIISLDNVNLDQDNDLADLVGNRLAGDLVNLLILRQGEEKQVAVTLGELR